MTEPNDLCIPPLKLTQRPAFPSASLQRSCMDLYRWMEQRASRRRPHNVRELLPDKLQLCHLPLKEVLQMGQQVHVWSCRLRREDQCHRQDITNAEYNHSIRVKSMALADAHSLACDMSIQRNVEQAPEIVAYTILEVTFDLRAVMSLAQTNKTTWIRCSQVSELQAPSARSKRTHHGINAQVVPSTRMLQRHRLTSRCTCSISGCTTGTTTSSPISST